MEEIPKDVLMILDVSGSMSGKKMQQMKQAVLGILSDLHDGDRFNILQFSDKVYYYKDSPVLANLKSVAEAKAYARNMDTIGGKDYVRGMANKTSNYLPLTTDGS
jgi:Mg-chelatase subunit ChlD